ncbi:Asp-tRNA(Asn)/Glu-tRNA(Gln) amidotransferase subunit GatC [Campylobacter sp. VicNov18]|uniref:Asp-tRNA(Asn)/Glu-tRNA(Gln) amidotransferase subunit GatC n=1 Tax=Campylobacter bilis TaxID=2691918 RepID=UPI00130ED03A|nr:Asp-tRNA(Asn)/Glu-tRNA(Gln) amidotransferase subunit GatC [Campylobacter bilis]MPV63341.1 Asp-tRNA(Asn)/Glu-tRNA(Gln) amidotransferase subunit GatC [Campylobacter hepaticus]MBM0636840.1 Asp-tRNA(Asn)/Glu-tRNA(Gln) amidotransferase subunit GatC [Campylobacter bilis]MCC8277411.1 Asp-tRNA(Asn)/Glu-tRNA(Gln) amidotransferase subunit GatC [Campylobacter bilis]MCC8299154.1 Asp-tRNA(Asn)/Glu-tRNA(Gln) amidotransferase subunit GatC [Campylobacter bilis]MCC8300320.1 Asp-tRNA(Asn)/Glu-tRNA(Gln) amido
MQIDEKLLTKLEKLSALQITQNRDETIAQLSEIVNFVQNLNELDLHSQEFTVNIIKGATPLRSDEIKGAKVIDQVLNCAPQKQEHFFVVPKIIE